MDETVKNEEVTEEASEPVQEENTPAELFNNPQSERLKNFLGKL